MTTNDEVEVKLLRRIISSGPTWVPGAIKKVPRTTAEILVRKGTGVIYDEKQKAADAEHAKALAALDAEKAAASKAQEATLDAAVKQQAEIEAAKRRVPTAAEQRRTDVKNETVPAVKRAQE